MRFVKSYRDDVSSIKADVVVEEVSRLVVRDARSEAGAEENRGCAADGRATQERSANAGSEAGRCFPNEIFDGVIPLFTVWNHR